MESDLFLLFAVALALYFAWSLNREEAEVADRDWGGYSSPEEMIYRTSTVACKCHKDSRDQVNTKCNRKKCIPGSQKTLSSSSPNQYYEDYEEMQLVIDNMTPDAVFNQANLPLTTSGRGEKRDVYPHANKLVYKIGRQAGIGLSLIDICKIRRETIETQTRYTFELIVQRDTPVPCRNMAVIEVQLILDFSQENGPSGEGFFNEYMLTNEPTPKIESITVLKTVQDYMDLQSEAVTQFYAFDNNESSNFAKQEEIKRIVRETRKKHDNDVRDLNVLLDENGEDAQDFYSRFPEYAAAPGRGSGMGTRTVDQRLKNC
jgi:hypothetical protein